MVLVDVDGVLNPCNAPPDTERYRATPNGITYRLLLEPPARADADRPGRGDRGRAVWASYWTDTANEWIGPRVGLPRLRSIPIPPRDPEYTYGGWRALHVAEWIGERPFVWLEDEPDVPDALAAGPGSART